MKRLPLGTSGLTVSEFCLGTMTYGSQTPEADAHAQLSRAVEHGIDFIDTAEMYPTNPVTAETLGRTEAIIGRWLAATGLRDRLVIATKITGEGSAAIPQGAPISGKRIVQAVEDSLRRLGVEAIDLYQLHWPNRGSYHFRQNWGYDPSGQNRTETEAHMLDVLETVDGLVRAGKLRHFGLSNETAWGTAMWLRLAEENGLPRACAIQNEYSPLCRHFDTDLAELSLNEDVVLLAYSPRAAGLLTGKYAGDVTPEGTRRALNPTLGGRITQRVWEAVSVYMGIAKEAGLDPAQMALAWCRTRPFVTIPIIGATTLAQLDQALGAVDLVLPDEVLRALDIACRLHPMPF